MADLNPLRVFRPQTLGVGVELAATASFLPPRVVTNDELVRLGAPLGADEMVRLCGVETRHWAAPEQATSDLAIEAGGRALAAAGLAADRVDRLILATVSPDYLSPSTACVVQRGLGLRRVPAFDLAAACAGFAFALDAGARAIATGDEVVLVIAAETRSRFLDVTDRATCALFGDGAAAAVLVRGQPGRGLTAIATLTDGRGVHSVYVPAGGAREPATAETVAGRRHSIRMTDGPQVYLEAVEGMLGTAEALLVALGMGFGDVDLIVPHQANKRLLDRLSRLGGFGAGKVFVNVHRVGNTAAAACAIALDEALRANRAPPGSALLLVTAGAGYTAGAALLSR